jgi:bifunctional DNA-binding transcriptional regulator/antitoxin component of YhaV-PrlF toxin-antitoxin module
MVKKIKEKKELYIEFDEDEVASFGWKPGQKLSIKTDKDGFLLQPFSTLEIDLSDFDRSTLEHLISMSCEMDVSINEVISTILENYIDKNEHGN